MVDCCSCEGSFSGRNPAQHEGDYGEHATSTKKDSLIGKRQEPREHPLLGSIFPLEMREFALLRLDRFDHDELAHLAAVLEDDFAGDLGKKRIILAPSNI